MEPISNPAMRVILRAMSGTPEGCEMALSLYDKTGDIQYLGLFENYARLYQTTVGQKAEYAKRLALVKEAGIL
jgi:hypothetical protein